MLTVSEELEQIAIQNGGLVSPANVVEFARDEKTALHSRFEWSDTEAAQQYRLWQARHVISLELKVIDRPGPENPIVSTKIEIETPEKTRVYISLGSDRGADGGYRRILDVLTSEELRAQMLVEAKRDMRLFRQKYSELKELADIFSEMGKLLTV